MNDKKPGDTSNVVYLNTRQPVKSIGYAQVGEVVDNTVVNLIGEAGEVVRVLATFISSPALAPGDWVRVAETRLGACIMAHIVFDERYFSERNAPEPDRWYELYASLAKQFILVEAVRGGWIMAVVGGNFYFLKARTVTFKDQDGRLVSVEKCGKAIEVSGTDGRFRIMSKKITLEASSISVSLGACLGSR
jgi:hypothetical protein